MTLHHTWLCKVAVYGVSLFVCFLMYMSRWKTSTSNERISAKKATEWGFSCESWHLFLLMRSFIGAQHLIPPPPFFPGRDASWCWTMRWTEGWKRGRKSRKRINSKRNIKNPFCSKLKGKCYWRRNPKVRNESIYGPDCLSIKALHVWSSVHASLLPPECSIYQLQRGGFERHFVSSRSVKRSSVVQTRGREELANTK